MAKNLIPEISKLLGVEMEEAFKIRCPDYEFCENGVYAFFENEGLVKKNEQGEFDNNSSIEFEDLCLGNYEIVKLPWEPTVKDNYFYPSISRNRIIETHWYGDTDDYALKSLGVIYRTREDAEAHYGEDYEKLTGKPLTSV
jgi:hypothetical protein